MEPKPLNYHCPITDCNLLCFIESWLNTAVPNHAIQPAEFFAVHRMDRTADSGKLRGGGVCVMANMDTALWELHEALTQFQAQHRDAAHIVVGDFNNANLKRAVPNVYQQREVARWTDQSVDTLKDALDDADWDMFWRSTDDVSEFTEAVIGFIGKLVDDTIPRTTIKKFPNQKPWVDKTICEALNSRTAAYNAGIISGNLNE
ncbi:hypothetical protein P4O66_001119 [Electrophorus voltai]|uniref:Endonuclease/exonuclease/phosphatase domain-containing protein n=1 Tax=Electrophorus voltai TaxID=2609070 RepID=A0AAD8ZAR8_9TELE|nr:hypothetical protein P4O66_001119 [Electrophorus voltai]